MIQYCQHLLNGTLLDGSVCIAVWLRPAYNIADRYSVSMLGVCTSRTKLIAFDLEVICPCQGMLCMQIQWHIGCHFLSGLYADWTKQIQGSWAGPLKAANRLQRGYRLQNTEYIQTDMVHQIIADLTRSSQLWN